MQDSIEHFGAHQEDTISHCSCFRVSAIRVQGRCCSGVTYIAHYACSLLININVRNATVQNRLNSITRNRSSSPLGLQPTFVRPNAPARSCTSHVHTARAIQVKHRSSALSIIPLAFQPPILRHSQPYLCTHRGPTFLRDKCRR